MEDDPRRHPSTTWSVATWVEAESVNRHGEESRREQPGTGPIEAANRATSSAGSQSSSTGTTAETQSGRTRCRSPNSCLAFGGRIEGARRGQRRSPTNQGCFEEGTRPMSRVACGREIGFNTEVYPTLLQQALGSLERLPDDVNVICAPERVLDVYKILEEEIFAHKHIRIHQVVEPQWCQHSTGTPPTEEVQTSRMVWHCGRAGDAKKGPRVVPGQRPCAFGGHCGRSRGQVV